MKNYPNAFSSAVFILMAILFCLKAPLMLTDTDYWWHLSSGDLIRKLRAIPATDNFSLTAHGYHWMNISWLWDVVYSWLNEQGAYLPLLLTALINALTLAILVGFILKRGAGPVMALVILLLALVPYTYMLTPRPHQITFLMTIVFYIAVHKASVKKNVRALIGLPVLMVLWVNMHGGFVVGFVILGAYLLQSLMRRERKNILNFAGIGVVCLAATFVNPLGIYIFEACNRTFSSSLIPIISEWQPLQFNLKYLPHVAYVFLFLLSFNPKNGAVSLAEKLLSVLWAIAALRSERNLPIFVLLSAPIFALNVKQYFKAKWIVERNRRYQNDLNNSKIKRIGFYGCVLITTLLFGLGKYIILVDIPNSHPIQEANYLAEHYKNRQILNDYFQGGFMLRKLVGTSKIFIDGRAETAYPPVVVADYLNFYYNQPGWETILKKYDIDTVVIPKNSGAVQYFTHNPAWRQVLTGDLDVIYIRLNGAS